MPKILIKRNADKPFLIEGFISTHLTKKHFYRLQKQNEILEGYDFIKKSEMDSSWWNRVVYHLTAKKLVECSWDIDLWGNVERVY